MERVQGVGQSRISLALNPGYKKSFNAPVIWLRGPALPEKIFPFSSAANHRLIRAIPPHKRGVCAFVRKCEAGSGGRDASGAVFARTNDAARTVKSCGPDARNAGVKSLGG